MLYVTSTQSCFHSQDLIPELRSDSEQVRRKRNRDYRDKTSLMKQLNFTKVQRESGLTLRDRLPGSRQTRGCWRVFFVLASKVLLKGVKLLKEEANRTTQTSLVILKFN